MTPVSRVVAVAAFIGIASASAASANPLGRNGLTFQEERMARRLAAGVTPNRPPAHSTPLDVRYAHGGKGAGTWQSLAATSPFTPSDGAGSELLMTDGTVMVQNNQNLWYRLTPDLKGSYANGTWTEAASMGTSYGPLYFASAVLPDGRMLVEGGEYNFFKDAETNLGAIFDPVANTWTSVSPPSGWHSIGDASSVILPNGTMMIGNCCYTYQALYGEASSTWTQTGTGKHDQNSEEGWTLLPNGQVLTEDVVDAPYSELYNPSTGAWSSAGNLPANLTQSDEIGPTVLRPDGTVFVSGANGLTAIYDTKTGAWSSGPTYPTVASGQLDIADGPASVLPDGNVLVATAPACTARLRTSSSSTVRSPDQRPRDGRRVGRFLVQHPPAAAPDGPSSRDRLVDRRRNLHAEGQGDQVDPPDDQVRADHAHARQHVHAERPQAQRRHAG